MNIKTFIEDSEREFDELNIRVDPPRFLRDADMVEKLKYFMPIAWQLLAPEIKKHHISKLRELIGELKKEVEGMKEIKGCEVCNCDDYGCKNSCDMSKNSALDSVLQLLDEEGGK